MHTGDMTDDQVKDLINVLRAILGALGNIGDQLEKIAANTAGKPPSSRRGAKS